MVRFLYLLVLVIFYPLDSIAQLRSIDIPGSDEEIQLVNVSAGMINIEGKEINLRPFFIGVYEVTFDQFSIFQDKDKDNGQVAGNATYNVDAVTRPTPPYEDFSKGMGQEGGFPMVSVTQQGALRYCKWLYEKTGFFFRLPTEAEWTHACIMGKTEEQDLDQVAWNFENGYEKFHEVGKKKPNRLKVHDMLGNVAEWTVDAYSADYKNAVDNSGWVVPTKRHSRTVKGGSYLSDQEECTCAYREKSDPRWQRRDPQIPKSIWWNTDAPFIGFRLVIPSGDYSPNEIEAFYKKAIID